MALQRKAYLVALLLLLSELCIAGSLPSFVPDVAAWEASDIVVVSATPRAGVFTVLETLKGKLEPGAEVNIPELRPKRGAKPISKYSFGSSRHSYTGLNVRIPKQVAGTRMVLFLSRSSKTEEGDIAGKISWGPATDWRDVRASTVWIDGGRAYCFNQVMNPAPSELSICSNDEAKLRARFQEVVNTQRQLFDVIKVDNMRLRAEALGRYIKSDLHRYPQHRNGTARYFAFQELVKCGPAGLTVIREMLDDDTLLIAGTELVDALVKAGGTGEELTVRLRSELRFWQSIGPTLNPSWRSECTDDNCLDYSPLRNRFYRTIHIVRVLTNMRFAGGVQAATELRDFWRSLPQLNEHEKRADIVLGDVIVMRGDDMVLADDMVRECDQYIRTAHAE